MEEQKKLTEEELNKKVEDLKKRFLEHKSKQAKIIFGDLQEDKRLKNIKNKNRKRNKMQKKSRRNNR